MERNTKILLGVGAGVLAYLLYRASRSQSASVPGSTYMPGPSPSPTPNDGVGANSSEPKSQADCPSGTVFIPAQPGYYMTVRDGKTGVKTQEYQEPTPAKCWYDDGRRYGLPDKGLGLPGDYDYASPGRVDLGRPLPGEAYDYAPYMPGVRDTSGIYDIMPK